MADIEQDDRTAFERLRLLMPIFFVGFFAVFGLLAFVSPGFGAVVGQAFGGLNEAVVAMVAWCRSL